MTPPYGLVQLHKKNFLPLARKGCEEEKKEKEGNREKLRHGPWAVATFPIDAGRRASPIRRRGGPMWKSQNRLAAR